MSVLLEGLRGEASYLEGMQGNTQISFKRIISRIIASAWYPVAFFN